MYAVKFKVIKTARPGAIRSSEILGECERLPEIGQQFLMEADGILPGSRRINTSVVKDITQQANVYTLYTESGSIYEVTHLGLN